MSEWYVIYFSILQLDIRLNLKLVLKKVTPSVPSFCNALVLSAPKFHVNFNELD